MMALADYRALRCPHCGGNLEESTDPANEDRYRHLDPIQCYRCLENARAEREYAEHPFPLTLLHRVELRRRG